MIFMKRNFSTKQSNKWSRASYNIKHHHRLMNTSDVRYRENNTESSAFCVMHSITSPNSNAFGDGWVVFFFYPLPNLNSLELQKLSINANIVHSQIETSIEYAASISCEHKKQTKFIL